MRNLLLAGGGMFVALLVTAAPVPRPKEIRYFDQPGWDRPIDPDKDCRFTRAGAAVTVEVPAKPHLLDMRQLRPNAPRLLRPVEGDFRAEVRVSADWRPTPLSTLANRRSVLTAGLLLVSEDGEKAVLRFEYGAQQWRGGLSGLATFTSATENFPVAPWGSVTIGQGWEFPAPKATLLRFERRKNECKGQWGTDGQSWSDCEPSTFLRPNLPLKVKVGIMASSTSRKAFKVTFDRFTLTRLDAEGKAIKEN